MVLPGGQANHTKDEYSQMSQFVSSRPWSQFGTGVSCGGHGSGRASAPRSDRAEIVKDWLSKSLTRKTKKSIIL